MADVYRKENVGVFGFGGRGLLWCLEGYVDPMLLL
jgi:hypothetical protein